jgi:uncharacterized protein (DUF58 family)
MPGRAMTPTELSNGKPLKRRTTLHLAGIVYIVTTLFLAVGAINSQNNLLFWAFGLAVAGLLVSGIVSGSGMMGLRVERMRCDPVFAGADMIVRYRVSNRNRLFPIFGVTIEELPGRGSWRSPEATWSGLLAPAAGAILHLPPRSETVIEAHFPTLKRGAGSLESFSVWTVFPFGLMRKTMTFQQHGTVIVRPAPAPLPRRVLDAISGPAWPGPRPVQRAGSGEDYLALREYAHGDMLRTIAWKPTARTGDTLVRVLASPRGTRVWIVLSFANEDRDAIDRSLSAAASLVLEGVKRNIAVGMTDESGDLTVPPRIGGHHAALLLDTLAGFEPVGATKSPSLVRAPLTPRRDRRDTFVVFGDGAGAGFRGPLGVVRVSASELAAPLSTGGVPGGGTP